MSTLHRGPAEVARPLGGAYCYGYLVVLFQQMEANSYYPSTVSGLGCVCPSICLTSLFALLTEFKGTS